jgi:hypothetical protein
MAISSGLHLSLNHFSICHLSLLPLTHAVCVLFFIRNLTQSVDQFTFASIINSLIFFVFSQPFIIDRVYAVAIFFHFPFFAESVHIYLLIYGRMFCFKFYFSLIAIIPHNIGDSMLNILYSFYRPHG